MARFERGIGLLLIAVIAAACTSSGGTPTGSGGDVSGSNGPSGGGPSGGGASAGPNAGPGGSPDGGSASPGAPTAGPGGPHRTFQPVPSSAPPSPNGGSGGSGGAGNAGSVALPASILEPILADAAQRSGILRDALEIVSAEEHTWPNAGLGCPVRGVLYTQALVDGYQIVIRADGSTFDYRASGPGEFRLCSQTKG